jgi:hypothetical protein
MSKVLIFLVAVTSPLLLWAAIVVAARRNLFRLQSMWRVLHGLHLILVIIGVVILLGFSEQPPARYGFGSLIFSSILIWPERWLHRQMEPPPTSPVPRD